MAKILTLTLNPAIDGASEADTVHPTHKIRTSNERYDPGGGGINVARVLTRLGGDVAAWYLAGGATGSVLNELLDRDGIARRAFAIHDHTRISHAVFESSTGLEYRFVPDGPLVDVIEWQACLAALGDAEFDWLVISGSLPRGMPPEAGSAFAKAARRKGAHCVVDTSGAALAALLAVGGLFLVKLSRGELERLADSKLSSLADITGFARSLIRAGQVDHIAVTLGHEGAVLVSADTELFHPAIDVPVKSAVGAGDSFLAGMVHALARDEPLHEAFMMGVAAGTAAVLTPGTDLCWPDDILRIRRTMTSQ